MSLRRADLRFALPEAPRTAATFGDVDGWADGLGAAGVTLDATAPDLAVATVDQLPAAIASGARMVIAEGNGDRAPLEAAGYAVTRHLLRPLKVDANFTVPLDQPRAGRYAVEHWSTADARWRAVRNRVVGAALRAGLKPEVGDVAAVGVRTPGPPAVLAAAAQALGVPADGEWFLSFGQGDELSRNVFHVFAPGSATPGWAVKFARVPGYSTPFDADERGLAIAAAAAGGHAPQLLGRLETPDGHHVSVETALIGQRLKRRLEAPGRAAAKRAMVDAVAGWAAAGLPAGGERLGPELARLREEVVPRWPQVGAAVLDGLERLRPVAQHNDLGSWNVIAGPRGTFGAVDWESANPAGLPIWDLAYFLTDALARLDGVAEHDQDEHSVRLYRGELPSSAQLRRWLREGAARAGVPPERVGAVLTLGWMHHGLSHTRRGATVADYLGRAHLSPLERLAPLWLSDPALGPGWEL